MNTPRDGRVKSCFRARKGHVFVHIDAGGLELSTIAQVWADLGLGDTLAKDIRAGVDRHSTVAAALLGTTYEDVRARIKAKDPLAKNGRQTGKVANFGIPGGLGSDRFRVFARAQYGLFKDTTDAAAEAEATRLIQIWKERWPEAQAYLDFIGDLFPRRGAYVSGTLVRSKRKRGRMTYCQRANFDFQGPAADSAKAGLVKFMYAAYDDETSPAYGCRLLAYLHDEILVEVPLDGLHEKSFAIRDLFVEGAQPFFPDVPITSSPAVGLCWSKRAGDPVFVEGRLVPYEWPAERNTRMLAALGAELLRLGIHGLMNVDDRALLGRAGQGGGCGR
jgi:DNA polymerase-1